MKVKLAVGIKTKKQHYKRGAVVDLADLGLDEERVKRLKRRRMLIPVEEEKPEPAPKKKAAPKPDHRPKLSDGDL